MLYNTFIMFYHSYFSILGRPDRIWLVLIHWVHFFSAKSIMNYKCVNMRLPLNKKCQRGLTGVPRSCTMGLMLDDVSKIILGNHSGGVYFLFASYYFRMYGSQTVQYSTCYWNVWTYMFVCKAVCIIVWCLRCFISNIKLFDFHKLVVYLTRLVVIQGYRTTLWVRGDILACFL